MATFPRIAPLTPEEPEMVTLLSDEDLRQSRAAMERAMYDALKRSDPGLACVFAGVLVEAKYGEGR